MATKLYLHREGVGTLPQGSLPSSEQSTLTADANLFDNEDGSENRVMDTTISAQAQTTLTNTSTGDTSAHNYYIARWVSPVLYQARIEANTWTVQYAATESNANANFPRNGAGAMYVNCYVWNKATNTKIGTILDGNSNTDGEEAGTSSTLMSHTFAGAAVTGIIPGESVLVYELWAQVTQGNTTTRTQTVSYDGTTEGSTSNNASFISTPENLQFTKTERNASIITNFRHITSTANTTQYWPVTGKNFTSTTENDTKIRFRTAGTLSRLSCLIGSNSTTSCDFTVRKNGSDTGLTVTSGSSANGYFEDLVNTVSVSAGDDINLKTVPSATGTFNFVYASMIFEPTIATDTVTMCASTDVTTIATASTTIFISLNGSNTGTSGVESRHKIKQKAAGTYSKMYVYVQSNARTTTTNFKSRKNGADGNLLCAVGAGQTGVFEDTTNSDTVADGDDYCMVAATGTGTENLVYTICKVEFTSTEYKGILITCSGASSTIATSLTRYYKPHGDASIHTTEANTQMKIRLTDVKLSNMQTYVHTGENTITANSTMKSRKNGADGNLSITYGSSEVGQKADDSNSDNIGSNDLLAYAITTGATGTTIEFKSITTYYQARTAVLDRIYKYNIVGRISLSRIYKWHMDARASLSRIYKYHIQARVSLSRIYKWNLEAALERISKSQIYKWHLQARVSLSNIYKYHLQGRISLSRIYKYNIIGRISLDRVYKYNIIGRISLSRIYKYNIIGRISLSRIYKWHINARVSLSRIYKYNIQSRVSLSRIYLWHVVGRISHSRTYLWNIIGRISLSRIYKWNLVGRISLSRTYKYHIANLVSLARIYKYNILGRVSLSRTYLFDILGRVSLSRIYKYNLIARTSLSRIYKYNLIGRISLSSILKYNIQSRISLSRTYLWDVSEAALDRISKSQIYKWNLIGRISLSRTYLYNITHRVSLSRTYLYNVLGRVSLTRIYRYHMLARASLERIYKYNIQARVSLSRIYKYNIIGRISLARIYVWNVAEGGLERISKAMIYKWHIVGRISLSRIYKYNVQSRVSLQRIYRFHMLARVSLSRTFLYNLQSRVSLSRLYKYNVNARVSLSRIYKYNLTNLVSLSRIYKYHITNRISKSSILKWNLLKRVSGSLRLIWNMGILITTRATSITGRTESRKEPSKPFDSWRHHFYRPNKALQKKRSRFTRG